jgi:NodT family efflux transporter outer membrane factor (OMF) lipoprotein
MLRGDWWRVFRQRELDALESRLEVNNQNIAVAFANFMAARAQIRAARAKYFPTVTTAPSATKARGSGGGHVSSYVVPVDVSWALDLFGRVQNTVRQSKYNAQVSAADLAGERLLEQSTLAETYFELRGQDALQELLDATVAADEQIVALARSRFETGVDTEIAVVQAEQALQAARVQATNAGVLRAQYEHAIATLIGAPATDVSLPHQALLITPPAIPIGAPSRLLERRPDIASAERKMAAANAALGVGYAAYFPDVTLTGSAGFASGVIGSLLSWSSRVWSVGGTISETLFDAGLRRATIDQSIAAYNATVASYRQTVLTAFQQVEDALSQTIILGAEIEEQRRNVALAERAFALEKARYESGIDPYINLMQEQTLLLEARQALVLLQVQRTVSAVTLVEALGGGWDRSELPSPDQVASPAPGADEVWR